MKEIEIRWRFRISMNLDESPRISERLAQWPIASGYNHHRLSSIVFFTLIGVRLIMASMTIRECCIALFRY